MNIDERLEKLTADVQLLAQMSASHESNLNQLFELQARSEKMQERNQELMAQVMEAINQIGRAVLSHEKRISGLEGSQA
jgi:predicted house-cleaning noncanonical NTP pyrophosphatase (MazG superfamily)